MDGGGSWQDLDEVVQSSAALYTVVQLVYSAQWYTVTHSGKQLHLVTHSDT